MTRKNKGLARTKQKAVPLDKLATDPERFQHREVEEDNAHIEALTQAIRKGGALDPITVWDNGEGQMIAVDGHHRVEAYRRAGWTKNVPVTIHCVTEQDAQFLTVSDNGKQRLQMTQAEKSNWAWFMVVNYPDLTARKIAEGPVSLRQVKNMRATKKRLDEAGVELPPTWGMALMLDKGTAGEWDDDTRDELRTARKAKLLEDIRAPLALAAQRDPEAAMEVVQEVMGKYKFEIGCNWLGFLEHREDKDELPF